MKKRIGFFMAILLFLTLVSAPFLSAQALTPTTRADYEAWFPTEVSILEQTYGTNNLGNTNAHAVLLSLGTYEFQFTAASGLFADPDDFTVYIRSDDLVLTFTGSSLPKSVCLGVIATDTTGAYSSGVNISYSVNGGTDAVYTTKSAFADNALVITDEDGINTVVLKGHDSAWCGYSYILLPSVNKLPQDAPGAPTAQSKTDASVTLTPITGAEYSMDGTTWQESNEFTGLSPATAYTFYARLIATDSFFVSPSSTGTAATTDKADQQAPAAPSVQSKTAASVTLTPITGAEYSMDGTTWQDSNEFTGLSPATAYTFYARLKETDTLFASLSSTGTNVTTDKADQQAPAAPSVQSKTAASVTLTPITGAEYSRDGVTWQESNEFTGLSPATAYTFYARLKETDTLFASPSSTGTNVTTDKADQQAPAAPSVQSKTAASVTLTPITGAEYSRDGVTWQDSNVFTGLAANTTYTFYARYKGTDTLNPSAASQLSVTTLKASDDSPATGDSSDLLVWLIIVSAASTGIAITVKKSIRSINKAEK